MPAPHTGSIASGRCAPDLELDGRNVVLSTWDNDPYVCAAYSVRTPTTPLGDDALLAQPVDRLYFAGEHTAGPWSASMEGALRSGLRAAEEVARALV
jgi:monoamine oxidase